MYELVWLVAMIIALFSGVFANQKWFTVSALLFLVSVLIAEIEIKTRPTWVYALSASLVILGATGGLTWPILRYPVVILGIVIGWTAMYWEGKKRKASQSDDQENGTP